MKKIALTQRLMLNENYPEIREALDIQWGKLLSEMGFLPIVLPFEADFQDYFEAIDIDGILLTGGNDLSTVNHNALSNKRDLFEKKLISYAIERQIPLFGVCRGMQVIAEFFGATFKRVEGQVATRHLLHAQEASMYYERLRDINEVNSYHNYAIDALPGELSISAVDDVGTIKAVEHATYKIFAQMWHPERETPFNPHEMALIRTFFSRVT